MKSKYYCRYCGTETPLVDLICSGCGKNMEKQSPVEKEKGIKEEHRGIAGVAERWVTRKKRKERIQ